MGGRGSKTKGSSPRRGVAGLDGGISLLRIESLSHVGIFTKDQKRARAFYTGKVGLVLREAMRERGYVALGTTKAGGDASLALWQPDPRTWGADYAPAAAQIGSVTGVGFLTTHLERTVARLRDRGVKVEVLGEQDGERYARFFDADRNALFLSEPPRPKARRAGLQSLDFVTIVTRDARRSELFFTKGLGLKARRSPGEESVEFRVGPKGTAILPFTPKKENYEDPSNYDADMAHIGEDTWIFFRTRDILAMQDELLDRGVRFKEKAERGEWGGMQAKLFDPDENVYWLIEPRTRGRSLS